MLSDISQSPKDKYCMSDSTYMRSPEESNSPRQEVDGAYQGLGEGMGSECLMETEFQFGEDSMILDVEGGMVVRQGECT